MPDKPSPTELGELTVHRLTGQEPFRLDDKLLDATVLQFWQWSSSDLVGNALRGVLAEYIVGLALGCVEGARQEWGAIDLKWTPPGGKKEFQIEVKSAAYVQTWEQTKLSGISFDIAAKQSSDSKANSNQAKSQANRRRAADVYVFCLLHNDRKATVQPLDLEQWSFFVVPTHCINAEWKQQKRVSLGPLERLHGPAFGFMDLHDRVLAAVSSVPS